MNINLPEISSERNCAVKWLIIISLIYLLRPRCFHYPVSGRFGEWMHVFLRQHACSTTAQLEAKFIFEENTIQSGLWIFFCKYTFFFIYCLHPQRKMIPAVDGMLLFVIGFLVPKNRILWHSCPFNYFDANVYVHGTPNIYGVVWKSRARGLWGVFRQESPPYPFSTTKSLFFFYVNLFWNIVLKSSFLIMTLLKLPETLSQLDPSSHQTAKLSHEWWHRIGSSRKPSARDVLHTSGQNSRMKNSSLYLVGMLVVQSTLYTSSRFGFLLAYTSLFTHSRTVRGDLNWNGKTKSLLTII